MGKIIKKAILAVSFLFASTFNAMADRDVAITVSQLPAAAQKLLTTTFSDKKVALSKKETDLFSKSYEVIFTNGNKIEFDSDGLWEKVSCERGGVPTVLIPSFILDYVTENFHNIDIVEIERDKRGYEVEMSNGVELSFNQKGHCVKID